MELRGVLDSGDIAELRAKRDALQEAWTDAASTLYAQASATSAPSGDPSASAPGDEVIEDADYEVVATRRGGQGDLSEPREAGVREDEVVSPGEPDGSPGATSEVERRRGRRARPRSRASATSISTRCSG